MRRNLTHKPRRDWWMLRENGSPAENGAPPMDDRALTRSEVLRLALFGAASIYLGGCGTRPFRAARPAKKRPFPLDPLGFGPIDRTLPDIAPRRFSGYDPGAAHSLFLNGEFPPEPDGAPAVMEKAPLVVVGGGIAGLAAAYLLRAHAPVILEQAPRFGGASRGESWNGADYSIGAAYLSEVEPDSAPGKLYRALNLERECRVKTAEDPVALGGAIHRRFWDGDSDPARREPFRRLRRYLEEVYRGENGRSYPDIPLAGSSAGSTTDLDRETFHAHLVSIAGGPLHPHLETFVEYYCWTALGAPARELSAAAGLNFLAAESGGLRILPGGNARVAERLLEELVRALPKDRLRPSSLAHRVEAVADGVLVSYIDASGKRRTLHAQAVVLACPKFVAARILHGMETRRRDIIAGLKYRSCLVANVLLKGPPPPEDFYDLFLLGDGAVDTTSVEEAARRRKTTDIVLGNYARPAKDRAVLTFYRSFPYDGARTNLLEDGAYEDYRRQFERQLDAEVLPLLRISGRRAADVRIARWGHSLPVARQGLIAGGEISRLREPFSGRVFFVEQDNWMLPSIETSITEAYHFAPRVEKALGRGG